MADEGGSADAGADGASDAMASPQDSSQDRSQDPWYRNLRGGEDSDTRAMQWFKFASPLLGAGLVYLVVYVLYPSRWFPWASASFLYLIPPAGKETIIPGLVALNYHPVAVALTIFMVDLVCALFISWNFPLAKRIPFLGRYINFVETKGSKKLEGNAALRAGAWIGLVLFVMVPFQGSGGVTASIIGRAVGMRPSYVVSSVGVGAITAGLIIAYIAFTGVTLLKANLMTGLIIILVGLTAAIMGYLAFRMLRIRRWEREDGASK